MHENHKHEQYFFDPRTIERLAALLERYERPCCLCAPTTAAELDRRGRPARLPDVDDCFAALPGYLAWDMYRPRAFDVVFCAVRSRRGQARRARSAQSREVAQAQGSASVGTSPPPRLKGIERPH